MSDRAVRLSASEVERRVRLCEDTVSSLVVKHGDDAGEAPRAMFLDIKPATEGRYRYGPNTLALRVHGVIDSPRYSDDALRGIVAHEMGHWFHRRAHQRRGVISMMVYLVFFFMGVTAASAACVAAAFGATAMEIIGLISVAAVSLGAAFVVPAPILYRSEFEADDFAHRAVGFEATSEFLNAQDGWYNRVSNHSHPSRRRRLAALDRSR